MKDVPVIFSAPMVQSLLREVEAPGTGKTMTRRLAWGEPFTVYDDEDGEQAAKLRKKGCKVSGPDDTSARIAWPSSPWQRVKAGDRLWVRESVKGEPNAEGWDGVRYAADNAWIVSTAANAEEADEFVALHRYGGKRGASVPSIHMPRWASRITLIVTATKIERLTAITEADALAEGVEHRGERDYWAGLNRGTDAVACFSALWRSLHGMGSWDKNPEVVALTFKVIKANIDKPEARAA
ncbi:hypothetical protein ACVILK_000652 [Bradyrhizobium embrapense]